MDGRLLKPTKLACYLQSANHPGLTAFRRTTSRALTGSAQTGGQLQIPHHLRHQLCPREVRHCHIGTKTRLRHRSSRIFFPCVSYSTMKPRFHQQCFKGAICCNNWVNLSHVSGTTYEMAAAYSSSPYAIFTIF